MRLNDKEAFVKWVQVMIKSGDFKEISTPPPGVGLADHLCECVAMKVWDALNTEYKAHLEAIEVNKSLRTYDGTVD